MDPRGGSQKTATLTASQCMNAITQPIDTPTDASENCLSAQGKRLSCEPSELMPYGSGASSSMTADRMELTAPCSETKASTGVVTSFEKRMRLLIASGLIAGITPTSTRVGSPQVTLDFAFSRQGGNDAGIRKADC